MSIAFTVHTVEEMISRVADATESDMLESAFLIKLNNILSKCDEDEDDAAYLMVSISIRCITYADNRMLFRLLSEFCIDGMHKYKIKNRQYAVLFKQKIGFGYSQSRLREDDMTMFLIALHNHGYKVIKEHQHFFSEEYQMYVEL